MPRAFFTQPRAPPHAARAPQLPSHHAPLHHLRRRPPPRRRRLRHRRRAGSAFRRGPNHGKRLNLGSAGWARPGVPRQPVQRRRPQRRQSRCALTLLTLSPPSPSVHSTRTARLCLHACARHIHASLACLQETSRSAPFTSPCSSPYPLFLSRYRHFRQRGRFSVFTFGFCRATSSPRRLPQYDHPQPRTPTDATPSPLNPASPMHAAAGRPKPAHRPVYPPAPSPPPPVYSCVNPVITQLGVVSGNTGCSSASTSCCAPYKCSTELDSSDDSVRSAQYEAKVDGSDAFSPAVNVAIVDACCILPVTDITGLVCNDAANPEYDPNFPSFPQYCKREDTPAGTTAVSDDSIVDIYDANQITAGETLFNQAVLNQLACLCCSGHVFVSSSSSTGTAGAGGLLIDGRTFTSVVTCNLPSAYPIIMTQLAPWADHLTLGAGVCP